MPGKGKDSSEEIAQDTIIYYKETQIKKYFGEIFIRITFAEN